MLFEMGGHHALLSSLPSAHHRYKDRPNTYLFCFVWSLRLKHTDRRHAFASVSVFLFVFSSVVTNQKKKKKKRMIEN